MQIFVSGRNFDITPAIQSKVEDAVNAALENKKMKISSTKVVADLEKNTFNVNILVSAKKHEFAASASDFDLYKAIDAACAKVDIQMTKVLDKVQDHQAVPLREVEPKAE